MSAAVVSRDGQGWVWFLERVCIGVRFTGPALEVYRPNDHMTVVRFWPFVVAWYTGPPF